jgi:hypothetical protein
MNYLYNDINFDCGFDITSEKLVQSIQACNIGLSAFPSNIWSSIALKFSGAVIGEFFAASIADVCGGFRNTVEQGYPDVLPKSAENASEQELRHYPVGLELKGTCGNIPTGKLIKPGFSRVDSLSSVNWKAHHREVENLLSFVWDFYPVKDDINTPCITAAFYCGNLCEDDWGAISGLNGRSTKLSNMAKQGRDKMANGLVCILEDDSIIKKYSKIIKNIKLPRQENDSV